MDVCSWDWGAITTITGAGIASATAWYISKQWRDQKGSEVISNEAKLIINDLNVIYETAHKLQDLFLANKIEELKDQVKLFVQQRNEIDSKMLLFNTLVEVGFNKKDIKSEVYKSNHLQISFSLQGDINHLIESTDNFRYENQGLVIERRGQYQDFNTEMKNYLATYALYKHKSKSA